MNLFENTALGITPLDQNTAILAKQRMDSLVKPIGSLGTLEDIAVKIAGITGKIKNTIQKKCVVIMSSDNGICDEGVSCAPKIITAIQTMNFLKGITGINVLSDFSGNDIKVVDIGIDAHLTHPLLIDKKIRKGTFNMAKGSAMTRDEAVAAIEAGIEITTQLINEGYNLIGTGEMGIGNTSTSSAIIISLLGCDIDDAVGIGAGLTPENFEHKKNIIKQSITINSPDSKDPIDVLSKVGGFDIAGLVGCYLAAANKKTPIVIDGFISATAALVAYKINPLTRDYMLPSHQSAEPGYKCIMKELNLEPILNLNMRLGEGSGCPLAFNIIEASLEIINKMATFEEASIDDDFLIDMKGQ
jgi:nicotinate-nucleotide--dimethylbenzimidazole phosphoribosyltransferase